jgi:hypothetical protein
MPLASAAGSYRFVPGDGRLPFCHAVIADDGYEIVRAQFERPVPWREGFAAAERHLAQAGRPRQALCAVELRCPRPYTPEGFGAFNDEYAAVLAEWGVYVDQIGSATRTNVAPELVAPAEQAMWAFAYTAPTPAAGTTWVLSGATEDEELRTGDVGAGAIRARVASVATQLSEHLAELGQPFSAATHVSLYTVHDAQAALWAELLPRLGGAALQGVRWYPSRPPIVGLELEIDARRVLREIVLTP